jgi:hypothetical protein
MATGHVAAQAVSGRPWRSGGLPQVGLYGICGGQNGAGAGFLRYIGFSLKFSFRQLLHVH